MDKTLILLSIFILLLMGFIVLYLVKNLKDDEERFVAIDGSKFKSQSDLDLYQDLLEKTKPLFSEKYNASNLPADFGFDKIFLTNIKSEGFKDLKTIIKYRNQFKTFSALINP